MMRWLTMWVWAYALTQLIETPIYAAALRRHGPLGLDDMPRSWPKVLVLGFVASTATHPFVWFVFPPLIQGKTWLMLLVAESFALSFEALYMWALGLRRAWLWALIANGASFGVGMLKNLLLE